MIVYLVLAIVVGVVAVNLGVPTPLALILAVIGPGLASWGWLVVSGRDAPTSGLQPDSPRTGWFLAELRERYRVAGWAHQAERVDEIASAFARGDADEGNRRLGRLSNEVARHPRSTTLISIWQDAWRQSGR